MSGFELRHIHAVLGKRSVLLDINLTIDLGEIVGLIGANGAGKTTLLKLCAGLTVPSSGTISLEGNPIRPGIQLARKLAYLEQNPHSHWSLPAKALVRLGRFPHKSGEADDTDVEDAMRDADIVHLRERTVESLSGGERARVFLARALAGNPQWLIADEPVAGLDPAHQLAIMQLLRKKAGTDVGIMIALHDLTLAARFCDRLVFLHEGKILAAGTPEEVLTSANLERALAVDTHSGIYEGEKFILPWRVKSAIKDL